MYKQVLETINGVEVFPMLSLMIFTVVFAVVLIWVITLDKKIVHKMEMLPLEQADPSNGGKEHGSR